MLYSWTARIARHHANHLNSMPLGVTEIVYVRWNGFFAIERGESSKKYHKRQKKWEERLDMNEWIGTQKLYIPSHLQFKKSGYLAVVDYFLQYSPTAVKRIPKGMYDTRWSPLLYFPSRHYTTCFRCLHVKREMELSAKLLAVQEDVKTSERSIQTHRMSTVHSGRRETIFSKPPTHKGIQNR